MKEDAESRRAKVAEAANKVAEKAEETKEEAAAGKTEETDEEAEEAKDKEERQRLKNEFDIYMQTIWPVITCDLKKDARLVEKALPSQEMERQFSMLREVTLKPVSTLPDGYGLRVRDLKEKVKESVLEADESLAVLKDDMNKAAKKFNDQQSELEEYVKKLPKELQEKLDKKQEAIKEAQEEYESAKASVETVEMAKIASEHFSSLLTNADICLMEMRDAFPELERLYEAPDESVSKQRMALSNIMLKMRERKREDSASAAGTPAKEEKRPQAKKMPEDIKKLQTVKNYEAKQELLKKKLEEARANVGQQRPNEPAGEPKKRKEEDKSKRDVSQVKPERLINPEKKARRSDETWSEAGRERSGRYEKAPYGVPTCFSCKRSGHKATQCKHMREDALTAGASQLSEADGRMFCLTCFKFFKFIRSQPPDDRMGHTHTPQTGVGMPVKLLSMKKTKERKRKKLERRKKRQRKPQTQHGVRRE